MTKLLAVLLVIAAAVGAASAQSAAEPDQRFLIVPGQSAGPVYLRMTLEEVIRTLGRQPNASKQLTISEISDTLYLWRSVTSDGADGAIAVVIRSNFPENSPVGETVFIGIYMDSRYRTRAGLGAGSTDEDVLRLLGKPRRTDRPQNQKRTLVYNDIEFVVQAGKVIEVDVCRLSIGC